MSRPRKHHVRKIWHPETLELQRRARKLMLDHGYPEDRHTAADIDVSHDLRIYYFDHKLTVFFQGKQVYCGHDDTGPWYLDDGLRYEIHEALVVLRRYMVLEDLSNV